MAKILILIGAHLCMAPRPQKEAAALAAVGHQVTVAGVWFDSGRARQDEALAAGQPWRFTPVLNFCPGQPGRWRVRLQGRVARELYRRFRVQTPALLGYGSGAMLRFAQQYKADLTLVHSEAGLWVGTQLLQEGYRVGVDFEDWFSRDLLPAVQASRPVTWIAELEATLSRSCVYRLAPSQAMAAAIATTYHTTPPTVVYNLFPGDAFSGDAFPGDIFSEDNRTPLSPTVPHRPVRLHWFSQTLGPGRGLETLLEALPQVQTPVELHLRGACSGANRVWLEQLMPPSGRQLIHLHAPVPPPELPGCIAQHDIGLALEQPSPDSRNLTVTNKLFQYLQAGLAVIATDTAGQREVLQICPGVGSLVPCGDAAALAQAIDTLAGDSQTLCQAKQAARQASCDRISWSLEQTKLLAAAAGALAQETRLAIPQGSGLLPLPGEDKVCQGPAAAGSKFPLL